MISFVTWDLSQENLNQLQHSRKLGIDPLRLQVCHSQALMTTADLCNSKLRPAREAVGNWKAAPILSEEKGTAALRPICTQHSFMLPQAKSHLHRNPFLQSSCPWRTCSPPPLIRARLRLSQCQWVAKLAAAATMVSTGTEWSLQMRPLRLVEVRLEWCANFSFFDSSRIHPLQHMAVCSCSHSGHASSVQGFSTPCHVKFELCACRVSLA